MMTKEDGLFMNKYPKVFAVCQANGVTFDDFDAVVSKYLQWLGKQDKEAVARNCYIPKNSEEFQMYMRIYLSSIGLHEQTYHTLLGRGCGKTLNTRRGLATYLAVTFGLAECVAYNYITTEYVDERFASRLARKLSRKNKESVK